MKFSHKTCVVCEAQLNTPIDGSVPVLHRSLHWCHFDLQLIKARVNRSALRGDQYGVIQLASLGRRVSTCEARTSFLIRLPGWF